MRGGVFPMFGEVPPTATAVLSAPEVEEDLCFFFLCSVCCLYFSIASCRASNQWCISYLKIDF